MQSIQQGLETNALAVVKKQLIGLMVLSIVIACSQNLVAAYAVLMGGLAYSLPDVIFVKRFLRYESVKAVSQMLMRFILGNLSKLLLKAALFVVVIKGFAVNAAWGMVGFAACALLFWIACMLQFSSTKRKPLNV